MKRKRIHISGAIVCQNNAHTIGAVIESLAVHCDEIIVVDGGSTDNTCELALLHDKVRLYERAFDGNIARQKNFAFAQCHGDWIFVLDTDELVSAQNAQWVNRWTHIPKVNWLSFPRYWLVEKEGRLHYLSDPPYYKDRQLRLFRNLPCFRYDSSKNAIHHEVYERSGFGIKTRNTHIFHFDLLLHSRAEREAKVERYRKVEPQSERLHQYYLYEDSGSQVKELPSPQPTSLHRLGQVAEPI